MKTSQSSFFLFFFTASVLALTGAYIAEFVFKIEPCKMCLYQRIPYFVITIASMLGIATKFRFLRYLCLLALVINATLAVYHVAIEVGWAEDKCQGSISTSIHNIEELLQEFSGKFIPSCSIPAFTFLGVSMAGWNFLYCLLLFLVGTIIFRARNEKKSTR